MKTCTKCKQNKELTNFTKQKSRKDGLNPWCKLCCKLDNDAYRAKNKDRVNDYNSAYRAEHKKEAAIYSAKYREEHKEEKAILDATYYKENKEKINAHQRIYNVSYHKENKETIAAKGVAYRKANPGKINALTAQRHAIKLRATPKNLTKEQKLQIMAIYEQAARLTRETGIKHQVDHILPLQGDDITGLHVPWNLQILTASENGKKNNKFDFTYENESWRSK